MQHLGRRVKLEQKHQITLVSVRYGFHPEHEIMFQIQTQGGFYKKNNPTSEYIARTKNIFITNLLVRNVAIVSNTIYKLKL